MKMFDTRINFACKQVFKGDVKKWHLFRSLALCCHGNIECLLAEQSQIINPKSELLWKLCMHNMMFAGMNITTYYRKLPTSW